MKKIFVSVFVFSMLATQSVFAQTAPPKAEVRNVTDDYFGTKYPAISMTTGANDRRVDVWQSAKTAARVQSANVSGKPILLSVDYDAGHGRGANKEQSQAQLADIYAFLFEHLGKGN